MAVNTLGNLLAVHITPAYLLRLHCGYVSDLHTPKDTSRSTDLLSMLEPLIEKGDATRNTAAWQQALASIHGMILLNSASN